MLFDWDDANRQHISEHGVGTEEAEDVIDNDPWDIELQVLEGEERFVQIGDTGSGRILVVVSTVRGPLIRVVTAYDAPRRQRLAYERWRVERYGTEAGSP